MTPELCMLQVYTMISPIEMQIMIQRPKRKSVGKGEEERQRQRDKERMGGVSCFVFWVEL